MTLLVKDLRYEVIMIKIKHTTILIFYHTIRIETDLFLGASKKNILLQVYNLLNIGKYNCCRCPL
jgi:hypothetical protein